MFVIQYGECTFHNVTVYLLHEVRVIVFGERQIRFTPIEYTIMNYLLTERPVSDKELIADIFHGDVDMWARDALDKHISNLRRKLKKTPTQLSILRVATFGYILVIQEGKNNR
jgi:DNA-binding response OmpR family regulator